MITTANDDPIFAVDPQQYAQPAPSRSSRLGDAFIESCRADSAETTASLRTATEALVDGLKAAGVTPERVVVALKEALTEFGGTHCPPSFEEEENRMSKRQSSVYRQVFEWCLDEYYAGA